jgi:DNA-binding MarR family transcriptional regulator
LILAAVSRAECHCHTKGVPWSEVAQHLGFPRGASRLGALCAQLDELAGAGSLERSRGRRAIIWRLTAKGRRRLSQARRTGHALALPEAPQHLTWRVAREEAQERIDGLGAQIACALAEAQQLVNQDARSAGDWARLSMTLQRQCFQFAWAIYCLDEWDEPDDAHADSGEAHRLRELGLVAVSPREGTSESRAA